MTEYVIVDIGDRSLAVAVQKLLPSRDRKGAVC
jgi:hypothetical protein